MGHQTRKETENISLCETGSRMQGCVSQQRALAVMKH